MTKNTKYKMQDTAKLKGQVAMPLVLIMLTTLIFIGATIAYVVGLGSSQVKRSGEAENALFLAKSGTSDALLKITFNYTYAQSSQNYTLNLSGGTVTVTVSPNTPQSGQTQIVSIGASNGILGIQRGILTVIAVDSKGNVSLISQKECQVQANGSCQ